MIVSFLRINRNCLLLLRTYFYSYVDAFLFATKKVVLNIKLNAGIIALLKGEFGLGADG